MVAGDDEAIEHAESALRDAGGWLRVRTASGADEARELTVVDDVDCVVSAARLPETDGLSLLETIREVDPSVPFLLYASDGSEELASEAISAGVTDYVPADITDEHPEVLSNRIENAVTQRQTETALEESERQLSTLIDNLPGVVYRCRNDPARPMELAQGECEDLTGYAADELESGDVLWGEDVIHPDDRDDVWETTQEALEADEGFQVTYRIRTARGAHKWVWEKGCGVYDDGELVAIEGFITDITERKKREEELEDYETLLATIADGAYILDDAFCFTTVNDALASMTGYDQEELIGSHISLIEGDEGMGGSERLRSELLAGDRDAATLETEIQRADGETFPAEVRFSALPSDDNAGEFRGTAGVVRDTTERKERKRQLERQREQLSAINQLHRVLQDITMSLVETGSREAMERRVCERLVETDSYVFAWIGDVDRGKQRITPRASAGIEEGYLDEITVTADESETGRGPTGTAVRTGEMQVMTDILTDPEFEPWRQEAIERGYRASAAIPITYDESIYGVLNVYTDREDAFDGHEREILAKLGEIIGHAINAFKRKKTLMSDTVTELEFRGSGVLSPLLETTDRKDYRIEIERTIPAGDDTFVHYLWIEDLPPGEFRDIVERIEVVDDVSSVSEGDDGSLFEVRVTNPPLTGTLAAHGGRLRSVVIEGGELRAIADLPPDADVRSILDTIRDLSPDLELVAQRTTTRDAHSPGAYRESVLDQLTEKQREALEAAYYAGFFDWPRSSSGEEIAETLDISPATLSEHIRTAERKLLETLFEDGDER